MVEEYDVFEQEYDDMDADIKEKEALVEEAKQVKDAEDWNAALHVVNNLKNRWKRIHYWESGREEELRDEFEGYLDAFFARRAGLYQKNAELKEGLIQKAEEVSKSDQFQAATNQMKELMDQWKQVGPSGKGMDDRLWERFNSARQLFYDRKHEHWEQMNQKYEEVRDKKSKLIEKAESMQHSTDWKKTSEDYRLLMSEWKQAGSAGREYEDDLWQAFCEARQVFYDKRNEYFDRLHAQQQENYMKKKELVNQARLVKETESYTRENTAIMKNFTTQWKSVGSCGREKENAIWAEFRGIMDEYFDGLRAFNEQKHADWIERMKDTIAYKEDQIRNTKRQISRIENTLNGLIGDSERENLEFEIEEKENFIVNLENDIEDIEKKLAE